MIITKDIINELRHFITPEGAAAIQKLGEIYYEQAAWDAVHTDGVLSEQAKGRAKFASFLKSLPESLYNASSSQQ